MTYNLPHLKYIFLVKIQLFVTAKSDRESDRFVRIRIGLALLIRIWIWIRIEVKSWIRVRIRIETNADNTAA